MKKPTLLILAAGFGSRYGGLKQIDPVGPHGETIMDYSIYDAVRAGFDKVVFVIRRNIEAAFKTTIGARYEKHVAVEYVFQELDRVPAGYVVPENRTKPWGTGQAVLMGGDVITGPFAAINADDFYGAHSFNVLARHLSAEDADYAMVGFILNNTLSEFGSVARGVCQVDDQSFLKSVTEVTGIERDGAAAKYADAAGQPHRLGGDTIVSMNLWGFTPAIFDQLQAQFANFLAQRGMEEKSEFYIPSVVNELVATGRKKIKVLRSSDSWFGVTYREDRPRVMESVKHLIARGDYPEQLWK